MNILALGAHPDDIEIGCAGTLINCARQSHEVYLGILTDGSAGGDPEVRRREQEEAAKIIGAKKVFWGPYEDTKLMVSRESIGVIDAWINEIKPTYVLVNYSNDNHQDHRHLTRIAIAATRQIKNVLFYEVPSSTEFFPVLFNDINPVLDLKMEALKAHASQITQTYVEHVSILDVAKASAHFRGVQGKLKFAEGFVPQRMTLSFDR
ncbi:MAG: PIG-L deacetylase family protein [Nitrospinota bacterium]